MSFKVCKLYINLILLLCTSGILTRRQFPAVNSRLRDEIENEERNAICCARKLKCCRSTAEEPNIEIRAVMVRCPSGSESQEQRSFKSTLVNSNREQNIKKYPGYDEDEPLAEMRVKNCNRKLIITMRIDNKGHISKKSQFVIIDHVFDPVTDKSQRLLNPYVIKLRQEHVTQMYGLKFLNYVNSEAKEVIYNKHQSNYTGCNTSRNNPTCGIVTYNDKVIPYSEGFCCSCDSLVNIKRQPKNTQNKSPKISLTDAAFVMEGVGCNLLNVKNHEDEEEEKQEEETATHETKRAKKLYASYQADNGPLLVDSEYPTTSKLKKSAETRTPSTAPSTEITKSHKRPYNFEEKKNEINEIVKQDAIQRVINPDRKFKEKFDSFREDENVLFPTSTTKERQLLVQNNTLKSNLHTTEETISIKAKQHSAPKRFEQDQAMDIDENDENREQDIVKKGVTNYPPMDEINNKPFRYRVQAEVKETPDMNEKFVNKFYVNSKNGPLKTLADNQKNFNENADYGNTKIVNENGKAANDNGKTVVEQEYDYTKKFNSNDNKYNSFEEHYANDDKLLNNNEKQFNMDKENNNEGNTNEEGSTENPDGNINDNQYTPVENIPEVLIKEDNKKLYKTDKNDKTHWNFERQQLTRDDADQNFDSTISKFRNKRSVLLGNMDFGHESKFTKRQISSGGSQIRGGQSCANRYTPHGLNPESYHESTHCLRFSEVWYAVYELQEPIVEHSIKIQIFEKHENAYGHSIWRDITKGKVAHLGSLTPNFEDDTNTVSITYNSKYMKPQSSMYAINYKQARLLVPECIDKANSMKYPEVRGGPKEYLIVHPDLIAVDGDKCNVAGVGFEAFYKQPNRCGVPKGTCLGNQPRSLWKHDHKAEKLKRKGCFFLKHYGILPENPIRKNGTDQLYLSLEYSGTYSSLIDMEITADSNAALRPSATAVITEVYVDSTSATKTILTVKITNAGLISSRFYTKLSDCPLDLPASFNNIKSKSVLIAPQHQHIFTLELRGRLTSDIFHCSVEALNANEELVALRRVKIQKADRCICTWHCFCACIGSSDGLKCRPMSIEQYHASGFQGSLPVATSIMENKVVSDILEMLTFILIFMLLTLLFLGLTKALIGVCCCPPMGMWGLCIILDLPKRMNRYYEPELRKYEVVYDPDEWPIHPTNKKRVRNISRTLEFCTNVLFFYTYPIIILTLLIKRLCCPYYTFETVECPDEKESKSKTTPSVSEASIKTSEPKNDEPPESKDKATSKSENVLLSSQTKNVSGGSEASDVRRRSRSKASARSLRSRLTNKTSSTRATSATKKSTPGSRRTKPSSDDSDS